MKLWCNETLYKKYEIDLTFGQLQVLWASVISIFLVGGAIGSLSGAWVADRIGRKGAFMVCFIQFVVAAILFQFCRAFESVEMLVLGRLIVGLASGLTTSTVPMYMTEIASTEIRGTLGVLCSMGVTAGVVVGQVASLPQVLGTSNCWHYALSAYIVLSILCFVPYPWFPESPKFLYIIANRHDDALHGKCTHFSIIFFFLIQCKKQIKLQCLHCMLATVNLYFICLYLHDGFVRYVYK